MNIKQGDHISVVPFPRCTAAGLVNGETAALRMGEGVALFGLTAGQSAFFWGDRSFRHGPGGRHMQYGN